MFELIYTLLKLQHLKKLISIIRENLYHKIMKTQIIREDVYRGIALNKKFAKICTHKNQLLVFAFAKICIRENFYPDLMIYR